MKHRRLSCLSYRQVIGSACTGRCARLSADSQHEPSVPGRREPLLLTTGNVVICLWLILFTWVGWRRRRHGGGASTAEAWGELFHPSQRHVRQERERQPVLRDDAESGAPPALLTSTPARRLSVPRRASRASTTRRNGSARRHPPEHGCPEFSVSSSPAHPRTGSSRSSCRTAAPAPARYVRALAADQRRVGLLAGYLRRRMSSERISTPAAFPWCSNLPTPPGNDQLRRRAGQPEDHPCPERRRTSQ
ncbi:DUF6191 domain-containing protein [Streptomyces sp. PTD9-10]|uniref:DUF6191 domain-containing protein n=1 Tax=Streptomyces sp. PTD9-10 TaxID=3120151 RepID=UPI003FCEBAF0